MNTEQGQYVISTDRARLDTALIHRFLSEESYWARGIPFDVVRRSLEHSLCFGVYDTTLPDGAQQVGFARVVTDYATFAYVGDVFILASHRGRGLSKWLMATVRAHSDLQGLRRWMLATRDAHGLYRQAGFTALRAPERWMEAANPNIYQKPD